MVALAIAAEDWLAPGVTGTTTCPRPAEVEIAMQGLIASNDPITRTDRVLLRDHAGSVVVRLVRATGEQVGEKRLDDRLSCAERARAAAVVVAAWEARLTPGIAPFEIEAALDTRASPAPPAVRVAQEAEPAADRAAKPMRGHLEPGFAAQAWGASAGIAPGAAVDLAYVRTQRSLIPWLGAVVVGPRSITVGPGQGDWWRVGLLAGAARRTGGDRLWIEGRLAGLLTLLDVSGRSFPSNRGGVSLDPGVSLGVRLGVRLGAISPWLEAAGTAWARTQSIFVQGTSASAELPRLEASMALGFSYGVGW